MKYIKEYEGNRYLKHSDPLSLHNKLRTFSEKIEKIIFLLKNLNNNDRDKVKRLFKDEYNITIYYFYGGTKQIKIGLTYNKDNTVSMTITIFNLPSFIPDEMKKNINFFVDFIKKELGNYFINENDHKKFITIKFKFHYLECDKILELMNQYQIYTDSSKYNL